MSLKALGRFIENASLINPPGLEMFLNDGYHTILQIDTQISVMMSILFSDNVNETTFTLLDKMNFQPNTLMIRFINNWIKYEKKKGNSPKKLVVFGQALFDDRYKTRLRLFKEICNKYPEIAFKTLKHFDEENDPMFSGDFLAGINTPLGPMTFHIKREYYDDYKIKEIERGPKYEGYTPQEALYRLASITNIDSVNKRISRQKTDS